MRAQVFVGLLLVGALLPVSRSYADGRVFEVSFSGSNRPGQLVYSVTYRLWMPDNVAKVRGLIVHQHGCGKGACTAGMDAADDLHWQALAKKWNCALLGPSYHQEDAQNCRLWCDPRNGSRTRFLEGLDALSGMTGHPELNSVPWCLWGHSGGAFWSSLMMTSDPDRVVAAWLRSGTAFTAWSKAEIPGPAISEAVYRIPVMCNPGRKEETDPRFQAAWIGATGMFNEYRSHGAPIGLAPDPKTSHECGDSRFLAIPYFDACLAARLPDPGSDREELRPMDVARGWLAVPLSETASAPESFQGDAKTAVWLPNETVAKAWSEYVKTGAVGDSTPPPAPRSVKAARLSDGTVEITWDADADFESGLRAFLIRRDGKQIGQIPQELKGTFGRPLLQGMSYHDTPIIPNPPMKWVDKEASSEGLPSYEVISVNSVGLESEPAKAP